MFHVPGLWWPTALLALVLLGDALMSIRPPAFIRTCLEGVGLPRDWWWTLIVVKLLAVAGLVAGLAYDGIGVAASTGVVVYFLCAVHAHVRARFLRHEFWLNCLGMLALAITVLIVSYVV
ncbi:DoxX family protein [Streptomyces sp. NPDC050095]|uniref:DoxX family protein n=1 Tax=unclassified Streptomyces TaxID=2593676 RepID=UPI003445D549